MALYLEPCNGGRQIVFDKAVILIGRQSDCDIVLENSRKVSRKHCCIAQVNHQYLIRDLASMNGVRVNGKRIKQEAVLEVGAEVAIGDVQFVLKDSNAGQPQPPELPVVADVAPGPPPLVPKPMIRRPVNISQELPVPIDEEDGLDFAIEQSIDTGGRNNSDAEPVQPMILSEPAIPTADESADANPQDDSDLLPPLT